MGLDMYLEGKIYLMFDEKDKEIGRKIAEMIGIDSVVTDVTFKLMYWRKANQIHNWFVKNIQNGEDDCDLHHVPRDMLEELLRVVNIVLKDHSLAPEYLPTQSGFFFGSTDYNEYYFEDLEYTKVGIEKLLQLLEEWKENGIIVDLYYVSSW